jgi:acetyl-CoA carboxylase biotin carboxylase subunit
MAAGDAFAKVLIANRGEIAVRIARACRELGIPAALACSAEDTGSAAARLVDDVVVIGPAAAKHSYLNIPALIEAARRVGADALHPGYGFLSENPDLAEVCASAGIAFIGPPASVMAELGDKVAARAAMAAAGVPLLPGSLDPLPHAEAAAAAAATVGYPLILKASAGGGGRGMQVVRRPDDLAGAFAQTRATAQAIFGDGRVYLEQYLESARHVEIQVLCDQHGNAVHLGERDCSVQRRHQKLIEESPAPGLSTELVQDMAAAALRGLRATGYVGAGTVEFLVDTSGRFYFMEVNCRIQVEHPVTEMVTGVDLVAEQIMIASGAALSFSQDDVHPRGTAIECRINAEDPDRGFLPTPGLLTEFRPSSGPFVRVDTHASVGYRVSPSYDSLLAKLIVWAPDRATAMRRMLCALAEFDIAGSGVHTTAEFLSRVLRAEEFRQAKHDTSFADELIRRSPERS